MLMVSYRPSFMLGKPAWHLESKCISCINLPQTVQTISVLKSRLHEAPLAEIRRFSVARCAYQIVGQLQRNEGGAKLILFSHRPGKRREGSPRCRFWVIVTNCR